MARALDWNSGNLHSAPSSVTGLCVILDKWLSMPLFPHLSNGDGWYWRVPWGGQNSISWRLLTFRNLASLHIGMKNQKFQKFSRKENSKQNVLWVDQSLSFWKDWNVLFKFWLFLESNFKTKNHFIPKTLKRGVSNTVRTFYSSFLQKGNSGKINPISWSISIALELNILMEYASVEVSPSSFNMYPLYKALWDETRYIRMRCYYYS